MTPGTTRPRTCSGTGRSCTSPRMCRTTAYRDGHPSGQSLSLQLQRGNRHYSLDGGFPAQIHNRRMETLVIAKDSTGQLWATWTDHATTSKVWVNSTVCSPGCNDATWGTPFSLNDAPLSQPAISSDDISSIIAFGGNKVGLMWSNQATNAMYFAVHSDAAADTVWTVETATSGPGIADDHINLKTDSSGRVYAATKTNLSGSGATVRLLVRQQAGAGDPRLRHRDERAHSWDRAARPGKQPDSHVCDLTGVRRHHLREDAPARECRERGRLRAWSRHGVHRRRRIGSEQRDVDETESQRVHGLGRPRNEQGGDPNLLAAVLAANS